MLAWTHTEHVFGKQAWLGALDGTALGREIHQELTEGTRPPVPAHPADRAGRERGRARRRVGPQADGAWPGGPGGSVSATCCGWSPAPVSGCPGCAAAAARAAARSSTSTRWPRRSGTAARTGSARSTPPSSPGPGLQLRLAVTALRAGVAALRDRGRHDRRGRRPHPGARRGRRPGRPRRRRHRLGQRAHGLPAASHGRRRLRRRRGRSRSSRCAAAAELGATRIIAVVAVPLALPRDERDYAAAPAGYIGLRSMGMIGVAERQISNLDVPLPDGTTLTDDRPGRRRRRSLRDRSRACCASTRTTAGCAPPTCWPRATPTSWPTSRPAPTRSSRPAARPGASRSRSGPRSGMRTERRRRARSRWCASRRSGSATWSTGASSSASRCPTAARPGGPSYEAHTAERPRRACRSRLAAHAGLTRSDGRAAQPAPAPEERDQEHDGGQLEPDAEHEEAPGRHRARPAPGRRSSARRSRSGSSGAGRWWR